MPDVRHDGSDAVEALDELLAGWDQFVSTVKLTGRGTGARKGRDRTQAQTAVVLALVTHVHETARLLRQWMPDGLTVLQAPLVRGLYETTLTAIWCDEVDDAHTAMMNAEGRFRVNLAETLRSGESTRAAADRVAYQDWEKLATTSNAEAQRFIDLASRVALDNAYGYYRMLSHLSHPSITLAEEYIDSDGDSVIFKAHPDPLGSSRGWSYLIAYCLIWSGMVANYYDEGRTRRNAIRAVARRLEVAAELPVHLSPRSAPRRT